MAKQYFVLRLCSAGSSLARSTNTWTHRSTLLRQHWAGKPAELMRSSWLTTISHEHAETDPSEPWYHIMLLVYDQYCAVYTVT